jgi:copper resistance protein B
MNRLISALAATTVLGMAAPVAAQSMQGMNMPGMTMPMPAKKKPAAKPATKGKPAKRSRQNGRRRLESGPPLRWQA